MSYEYLKPENVVPVELCREIGRVEEHTVALSPADEERAMRLHRESIIIDFHNHLRVLPEDLADFLTYSRSGRPVTGYEGTKKSGMTACLYGLGSAWGRRYSPVGGQFEDLVWEIGMVQADMDHHRDTVSRCYSAGDLLEAKKSGRTAIILHAENGGVIGNDLDRLDVLYGLGMRCLGLSFNFRNNIADGLSEKMDSGLSNFGYKVVERMNRLGMLIDLSHSSDLSKRQAIEASKARCCFTHTLAQGLNNNPKGLSDDMLRFVADHGGVMGVEAVPNITSFKSVQTVFDVIDHVDYIVKRVGVDLVAIGTDTIVFGIIKGDHFQRKRH